MARSINMRTRLSLPRVSFTGDPTPRQLAAAIEDLQRNLIRWSDSLPFGAFGFHAKRSTHDDSITNGSLGIVAFNAVNYDLEGWWGGSNQERFYCPPGGSGWYAAEFFTFIDATLSEWFAGIRRITAAGAVVPETLVRQIGTDRCLVTAVVRLEDGDGIEAYIYNNTGTTLYPVYYAGDGSWIPASPSFRVLRISLL